MAITILFFYATGLFLLLWSLETKDDIKGVVYLILSIYSSFMGYYLSFTDANYTSASYFPMGMLAAAIIMAIMRIWGLLNPLEEGNSDRIEGEAD